MTRKHARSLAQDAYGQQKGWAWKSHGMCRVGYIEAGCKVTKGIGQTYDDACRNAGLEDHQS